MIVPVVIVLIVAGGFAANDVFKNDPELTEINQGSEVISEPINTQAVTVDPCVLFSEKDIERILDGKFEVGLANELTEKTPDNMPITECEYRQANDGSPEGLANAYILKVRIENYSSPESARSQDMPGHHDATGQEEVFVFTHESQRFRLSLYKESGVEKPRDQARLQELAATKF